MRKHFICVLLVTWILLSLGRLELWASCEEICGSQCESLGSGPEWAACMESCVKDCQENFLHDVPPVPEPVPAPEEGEDIQSDNGSVRRLIQDTILADAGHRYVLAQNDHDGFTGQEGF
jgi:hypothetical protein